MNRGGEPVTEIQVTRPFLGKPLHFSHYPEGGFLSLFEVHSGLPVDDADPAESQGLVLPSDGNFGPLIERCLGDVLYLVGPMSLPVALHYGQQLMRRYDVGDEGPRQLKAVIVGYYVLGWSGWSRGWFTTAAKGVLPGIQPQLSPGTPIAWNGPQELLHVKFRVGLGLPNGPDCYAIMPQEVGQDTYGMTRSYGVQPGGDVQFLSSAREGEVLFLIGALAYPFAVAFWAEIQAAGYSAVAVEFAGGETAEQTEERTLTAPGAPEKVRYVVVNATEDTRDVLYPLGGCIDNGPRVRYAQ